LLAKTKLVPLQTIASFLFCVFLMLTTAGCNIKEDKKEPHKKDFILEEKDLIPEGVAFDSVTNSVFISSTYKRKIIRIDSTGKVTDFIKEGQNGIWSTIGMEADARRRYLWVVSSQAKEVLPLKNPDSLQWRSAIYQYNIETGSLINSFLLPVKNVFLNDLTVSVNGDVYVTESMQNNIYRLDAGADSIRLFLSPKPYTFLNGIIFSGQPDQLFVSATEGIIKIDITTGQYSLLKTADTIDTKEIDGLTYYKNSFIAHQSTKVARFYLDDKQDIITSSSILDSGTEFDATTTGEQGNGFYYFIVNSQVQSGIDFKKQVIKPMDSLEKVIIRRIPLQSF
jgi:sugar lactone lactonase YvrE